MSDRLVMFLYMLARDELPLGRIERILVEVEKAGQKTPVFSEPHLASWAANTADRLQVGEQ